MLQDILSGNLSFAGAIIFFTALLIVISIHEFAHAWMAYRLGDPTAKLSGRLTLNPIAHLDPLGTLLILIIGFGWGKPVPVDPFNFRDPRKDSALVSAAGSISNLLLAIFLSIVLRLLPFLPLNTYALISPFIGFIFVIIIKISVMLAIFNLLPIHPLDGGKILVGLLPREQALVVEDFLNKNGIFLLILLVFPFFGSSLVFQIISPIINFILSLLLPGLPFI